MERSWNWAWCSDSTVLLLHNSFLVFILLSVDWLEYFVVSIYIWLIYSILCILVYYIIHSWARNPIYEQGWRTLPKCHFTMLLNEHFETSKAWHQSIHVFKACWRTLPECHFINTLQWKLRNEQSLMSTQPCFQGVLMHMHKWKWKCDYAHAQLKEVCTCSTGTVAGMFHHLTMCGW